MRLTARGSLGLIAAFCVDQSRRSLSPETVRVRRVVLRSFYAALGGKELPQATKEDINEWLDSLDLTARSRGKYLSHLHVFYRFCMAEGVMKSDPTALIDRPKVSRLLPRPISDNNLQMALDLAPPRIEAMLSLACYGGLRCMEIAAFQVEWIWRHAGTDALVIQGKGGVQRMVPLATAVDGALRRYGLPRSGHVFLTRYGTPYQPASISKLLADYLRGVGIEATAHQLRHWFGTEVYRRSRDLVVTQELMGHSEPSTTRGYVAISPNPETMSMLRSLSVVSP